MFGEVCGWGGGGGKAVPVTGACVRACGRMQAMDALAEGADDEAWRGREVRREGQRGRAKHQEAAPKRGRVEGTLAAQDGTLTHAPTQALSGALCP